MDPDPPSLGTVPVLILFSLKDYGSAHTGTQFIAIRLAVSHSQLSQQDTSVAEPKLFIGYLYKSEQIYF